MIGDQWVQHHRARLALQAYTMYIFFRFLMRGRVPKETLKETLQTILEKIENGEFDDKPSLY